MFSLFNVFLKISSIDLNAFEIFNCVLPEKCSFLFCHVLMSIVSFCFSHYRLV